MKTEVNFNCFWLCITILSIAFYGEPDLIDAIIYSLTQVKGW
jgi:hypothetical protein